MATNKISKPIKYKVFFNVDDTIESLYIKLDNLINQNEHYYKKLDELSRIIDNVDDEIDIVYGNILKLQKQNNFTYYCRYGRFPND